MNERRLPYHLIFLLLALIAVLYLTGSRVRWEQLHDPRPRLLSFFTAAVPGYAKVVDILDGTTFVVAVGQREYTIRLAGVSLPAACNAAKAGIYTRHLLQGQVVRLVADPTNKKPDATGTLWRQVYLPNGVWVNEKLRTAQAKFCP